ncbi:hypothetical protein GKO28_10070 [Deefgea sp. CFH1-16]|nr:hypothetical protein [Deefgea sp. CFH1-16]
MHKPVGTAIGIHGAWGAGKSSAINLIKHHLQAGEFTNHNLEIIEFNPWWFTGIESLAQSFLSEIGAKFEHEMPGTRKK